MKKRNIILTLLCIVALIGFIVYANGNFGPYQRRVLNLCAIYTVLALSMNLINGFTGLFSLGHAGFMAVGAYTTAILTMSEASKQQNFFMTPIVGPLESISLPFLPALIIGGLLSAFVAFLIGAPTLRLKGDYLAIATLGFSEIIRIIFTNTQSLTNGSLGLKGIPNTTNLWWSFGCAAFTLLFIVALINSSYGKAFKAIREDEIAAESMGINLFKHKILSFVIGAFFAGIGGGLLGNLLGSINPNMFRFILTFNVLLIIVLGGMGSITGTVLSSFIVTSGLEYLRFLDESVNLGFIKLEGVAGLRMVVFSTILMVVVIFFNNGLMGNKEFSWDKFINFFKRRPFQKKGVQQ
ncbi:branched-chain amino acid ABC transporter permease [Serpentinicella alkaliphila]|uniref:Amino acid/amide ABC transporter membrane protein 2 (HAAT family) n=1 Tax=Serpentinicella alkaliphila TaxID=1734049 RepID=A0A4R2TGH7_9FIRM|nr:branched-chain amino acid ABC transporter permease [Serpentinicella alkaliphila]QUH24916.1 branched-chain amino acid ABC transporter permease [Serpentinicella alkaliphila]TCQ01806.1 amino acid/amide ABC transporter membrane protein 2 (HAAT family) [Serpentinicella alkaliphila]